MMMLKIKNKYDKDYKKLLKKYMKGRAMFVGFWFKQFSSKTYYKRFKLDR